MENEEQLEEEFKNLKVEITLFPEKTAKKFGSFKSFKDFIENEFKFWENYDKGKLNQILNHFNRIKAYLQNAVANISNLQHAKTELNNALNLANTNSAPCVYSQTTIAEEYQHVRQSYRYKEIFDFNLVYPLFEIGAHRHSIPYGNSRTGLMLDIKQKYKMKSGKEIFPYIEGR